MLAGVCLHACVCCAGDNAAAHDGITTTSSSRRQLLSAAAAAALLPGLLQALPAAADAAPEVSSIVPECVMAGRHAAVWLVVSLTAAGTPCLQPQAATSKLLLNPAYLLATQESRFAWHLLLVLANRVSGTCTTLSLPTSSYTLWLPVRGRSCR